MLGRTYQNDVSPRSRLDCLVVFRAGDPVFDDGMDDTLKNNRWCLPFYITYDHDQQCCPTSSGSQSYYLRQSCYLTLTEACEVRTWEIYIAWSYDGAYRPDKASRTY